MAIEARWQGSKATLADFEGMPSSKLDTLDGVFYHIEGESGIYIYSSTATDDALGNLIKVRSGGIGGRFIKAGDLVYTSTSDPSTAYPNPKRTITWRNSSSGSVWQSVPTDAGGTTWVWAQIA